VAPRGWGVDALLGEEARSHQDVDLVVRVDDVLAMRSALEALGFVLVEGVPDSNFVLRDGRHREVDVHPVRVDEGGNGLYRMENGKDWLYPLQGFAGRGQIRGRQVLCLTPDIQMINHAGGYEPHDTDLHDMRQLHDRFGTKLLGAYIRDSPPPPEGPSHVR
jgi:lincosamide nucleotidyltransferase A/C/D/E